MLSSVDQIINILDLKPHPEGGYFKETYRSSRKISEECLGQPYKYERNYSTCIYFLLTSESSSCFHRIIQDEIWHFYDGAPIRLHTISEFGIYRVHHIGIDMMNGETPQLIVPGGCWFAAEVIHNNSYSLVGCTVSPGFCFEDFELKSRQELISLFPEQKEIISRLTHY